MRKRKALSRKQSKRNFRRGAKTKRKNVTARVMRGGYRI